jgi:hypothetical protein
MQPRYIDDDIDAARADIARLEQEARRFQAFHRLGATAAALHAAKLRLAALDAKLAGAGPYTYQRRPGA